MNRPWNVPQQSIEKIMIFMFILLDEFILYKYTTIITPIINDHKSQLPITVCFADVILAAPLSLAVLETYSHLWVGVFDRVDSNYWIASHIIVCFPPWFGERDLSRKRIARRTLIYFKKLFVLHWKIGHNFEKWILRPLQFWEVDSIKELTWWFGKLLSCSCQWAKYCTYKVLFNKTPLLNYESKCRWIFIMEHKFH